jgi:hypothetical protein
LFPKSGNVSRRTDIEAQEHTVTVSVSVDVTIGVVVSVNVVVNGAA